MSYLGTIDMGAYPRSMEILVGIGVAVFLGWAWFVASRGVAADNRREAERRRRIEAGEPVAPSSWEGSAEQNMLKAVGEISRSEPPY